MPDVLYLLLTMTAFVLLALLAAVLDRRLTDDDGAGR